MLERKHKPVMRQFRISPLLLLLLSALSITQTAQSFQLPSFFGAKNKQPAQQDTKSSSSVQDIHAAVIVPGFLTGDEDFKPLAQSLSKRGIPTAVVPLPPWHWIPCVGGRSMRPMLERIDYAVRYVCSEMSKNPTLGGETINIPPYGYSLMDCYTDFMLNPGGALKVGGSDEVDEYPTDVEPRGDFTLPGENDNDDTEGSVRICLIGHSAGGWISRVYLSDRSYGGKVYGGTKYVHSLVTLGTPHGNAPGPAFKGIEWCNREPLPIRGLAVAGVGSPGDSSGKLTQNAYAFCDPDGTGDGSEYDGDGLTPVFSSLFMEGDDVEKITLDGVTHYPWSDAGIWGDLFAPELAEEHRKGKPWYGDDDIVDQWVEPFLSRKK